MPVNQPNTGGTPAAAPAPPRKFPVTRTEVESVTDGTPRYEIIARLIEEAIATGKVKQVERLPTVRQISTDLGVSATTAAAAYNLLAKRGWIRSEVGRGTFATRPAPASPAARAAETAPAPAQLGAGSGHLQPAASPRRFPMPWRRRSLVTKAARLRSQYSIEVDCSTGRPDPEALPWALLAPCFGKAVAETSAADLQYSGPEPLEPLARILAGIFERDGIPVQPGNLLLGSSAQQWMMLGLEYVRILANVQRPLVAIEQPGYPTIMDSYERVGARLVGVEVDEAGAIPESLDAALREGAQLALLTPRAQNPVGASWTPERRAALADVLAQHPRAMVLEDDQLGGIAAAKPGSLLADMRLEDRVMYVRSFSKSISPDLRMAALAARPRARAALAESKALADGWSSRLSQRVLAAALADPQMSVWLERARQLYRDRREAALSRLAPALTALGGYTSPNSDGLNLWIHLPADRYAPSVVERAAARGVLVAPGEAFYIFPGHHTEIRLNAGAVPAENAAVAGAVVAEAILESDEAIGTEIAI